ncbi:hypothetical protein M9Y10_013964 [Tritrichomonas musculus]|uniref:Transmembrane protein n=1 Tax=Tritrichomonas musculus TaxID=1915356 RepID=A0ABR2KYB0_9EUKA
MNITILSLISSASYSLAPFFVGNKLSLINVHFSKHITSLLYNQESLLLRGSYFEQIYGNVLLNEEEEKHQLFKGITFNDKFDIGQINSPKSVTIMNCFFTNINALSGNPLKIDSDRVSLYITDTLFDNCKSENGVIYLSRTRCATITHICSRQSLCSHDNNFLFYSCNRDDFSIFLYNSIYESTMGNYENSMNTFSVRCLDGDQYFKCNNLTKLDFNGFQFDNVQCLLFSMSTINACAVSCFSLSGNKKDREIDRINFYSSSHDEAPILRFSSEIEYTFTASNCVLLTLNKTVGQDQSEKTVRVILNDCVLNQVINDDKMVTLNNPTYVNEFHSKFLVRYPHFTYKDICAGQTYEEKNEAHNCNVGDCIPNDCERTIGFPENVVPYTTIVHGDLQSFTFSPSFKFSSSNKFSQSADFSQSEKFQQTSEFSQSEDFQQSSEFSQSEDFSLSNKFSNSLNFSLSTAFTKSKDFSETNDFSGSKIFTNSCYFSFSEMFSNSADLFNSKKISQTFFFLQSFVFSQSDYLPNSFMESSEGQVIDKDANVGGNNKNNNKGKLIGIIVAVVAAAAIIAAVITIVAIKKRKIIDSLSEGEVITHETAAITVDNVLQSEMNVDDPFAVDFQNEL